MEEFASDAQIQKFQAEAVDHGNSIRFFWNLSPCRVVRVTGGETFRISIGQAGAVGYPE